MLTWLRLYDIIRAVELGNFQVFEDMEMLK